MQKEFQNPIDFNAAGILQSYYPPAMQRESYNHIAVQEEELKSYFSFERRPTIYCKAGRSPIYIAVQVGILRPRQLSTLNTGPLGVTWRMLIALTTSFCDASRLPIEFNGPQRQWYRALIRIGLQQGPVRYSMVIRCELNIFRNQLEKTATL